jgi:putative Mg2+ transporter-C (MgtC) family protein
MFIAFGAAMFTLLSAQLAGVPADAARIAAQIIPGIGFIGAGSILHTRGLTTGLTSAATMFVVASIGMAAGGGLYATAMFATGLVLLTLFFVGQMEETFNVKLLLSSYEVTGASIDEVSNEVNRILEPHHRLMLNVASGSTGRHVRLQFDIEGCNREQKQVLEQLKASTVLESAVSLGRVERE